MFFEREGEQQSRPPGNESHTADDQACFVKGGAAANTGARQSGLSRAAEPDTRQDTRQGSGLLGTHGPSPPSRPPRSRKAPAPVPLRCPSSPGSPPHSGQGGRSPALTRCPRPAAPPPLTQHRGGSPVSRPRDPRPCPGPAALAPYPRELRRRP